MLEAIGQRLDPTDTQYEHAKTSYEAVGAWLMTASSDLLRNGQVCPHGSVRIQTANRPWVAAEFDVDVLYLLFGIDSTSNPAAVKKLVGDRFKEHERYRSMLIEKNRCWQLRYAGEFHLDITPAILNPACGNGGLLVPDKTLRVWKATHPIAYAERFEARARLAARYRSLVLAKASADIEGFPEPQRRKGVLKRGVQLCKRHRDVYFADQDSSLAPISVIITTLLAWSYEECVRSREYDHDLDLLVEAVRGMPSFIQVARDGSHTTYVIPNETTKGENFAEKWNEDPRRAAAFFEWHQEVVQTLDRFVQLQGEDALSEHLINAFGRSLVQPVFHDIDRAVNAARAARRLGVAGGLGISTASTAATIRPNNFFGRA